MPVITFEARVRHMQEYAIIDLKGDINSLAIETFNNVFAEASGPNTKAVLLNFNEVEYINSTGIALIVGLMSKARQANQSLATYGLSDHYVSIFNITRLSDYISLFPDENSALEGVRHKSSSK
ncbi:MAG TPA: STAS domain-containing protein [Bacteroidales bacterium]|nr:STAS domain-containing protein [Bacteroidales bacterium]